MTAHTPQSVQTLVEKQVQRWQQERDRRAAAKAPEPLITISREFGAQGAAVGKRVADKLEYPFWDHELVDAISEYTGAKTALLDSLDEHARSSFEDFIAQTLMGRMATENEYVRQVATIVHTLDGHGGSVIVGRGAQYLLSPERALRVRVIAPLDHRVASYAAREGIDQKAAAKHIAEVEKDRQKFVRHHYDQNVTNPAYYDLLVNTALLSLDAAAATIVAAYRAKFSR